jgi:16S rRNA (guanine527-N7)-methyltransferase
MSEEEARRILAERFDVSRETLDRLSNFVDLLTSEAGRQNLISRATIPDLWSRHILDSAQLVRFAPHAQSWIDLGTGAGFPGLVIAAIHPARVTMVESRRLRVDFLLRAAETLSLPSFTQILCSPVERLDLPPQDVISARAFAPLDRLFGLGERFAAPGTRWVLPKGRTAQSELEAAGASWQGMFHVEPSMTDPEAGIIIAEGVQRKGRGRAK